jgi:glycosyltransferase involved in cell wall biosynthesis
VEDVPKNRDGLGRTHGRSVKRGVRGLTTSTGSNSVPAAGPGDVPGVAPVSVIIPCYKCAATIERAVDSVVLQSWRPAELILVDDGNAEDALNALRMQERRLGSAFVHIISLPQNQGAAAARNAGWDAATQPYVAFLDADDAWHPQKLDLQLRFMLEHPDVQICGHNVSRTGEQVALEEPAGDGLAKVVTKWRILASNTIATSTAVLKRNLGLRFDAKKRRSEDYGLWLAAAAAGMKIARLDAQLASSYKAVYGAGGLSAALWKMERAELGNYASLRTAGDISAVAWVSVSAFSLAKYARRFVVVQARRFRRFMRTQAARGRGNAGQ